MKNYYLLLLLFCFAFVAPAQVQYDWTTAAYKGKVKKVVDYEYFISGNKKSLWSKKTYNYHPDGTIESSFTSFGSDTGNGGILMKYFYDNHQLSEIQEMQFVDTSDKEINKVQYSNNGRLVKVTPVLKKYTINATTWHHFNQLNQEVKLQIESGKQKYIVTYIYNKKGQNIEVRRNTSDNPIDGTNHPELEYITYNINGFPVKLVGKSSLCIETNYEWTYKAIDAKGNWTQRSTHSFLKVLSGKNETSKIQDLGNDVIVERLILYYE